MNYLNIFKKRITALEAKQLSFKSQSEPNAFKEGSENVNTDQVFNIIESNAKVGMTDTSDRVLQLNSSQCKILKRNGFKVYAIKNEEQKLLAHIVDWFSQGQAKNPKYDNHEEV